MIYLDTSALAKLVVTEKETKALRRFLAPREPMELFTSALTRAELLRVAYRQGSPDAFRKCRDVLAGVAELTLTEGVLERAGTLPPPALRTLDAIHLSSALELGAELEAFVAYDARLLDAARNLGCAVLAPAFGNL